jgi:PAS domain S-box-containing protein
VPVPSNEAALPRPQGGIGSDAERVAVLEAQNRELQRSIEELHAALGSYERVFTDNPIPGIVYRPEDLSIVWANSSALSLYGYSSEQMLGLNMLDLFAPDAYYGKTDLAGELSKTTNSIGPLSHRGAVAKDLIVSIVIFTFSFDGTDGRVAMIQDETARHVAEEALRSGEERFRELFENANDVIFLHDLKGIVIAINRAAEYITGYTRSEVIGRSFADLVAPEARNQIQDSISAHLGGSAAQHYELPILSRFGTRRYLEVSSRVIYRRGHPMGIQGIGRDITERKLAQQRLMESAQQLQSKNEELSTALALAREATQLKEQFLANTSHELRTPMNGIMGMVNLLRSTDLTDDQREYADAISQCANDLLTIINDLLDLSQIEAGRFSLKEEPFDLHDSVRAVVKLLRIRAHAKALTLDYETDPLLPAHIIGDSVRFRQILTNLIANAIKFTAEGAIQVRLKMIERVSGVSPRMRVEVIDSGIGVEESVRERIFEAFFQAGGTTRRRYGGTGLGLTISKQLAEIMGGEIGTYNNVDSRGATFWFEVPLRLAPGSSDEAGMAATCPEVAP